MADDLSRPSAVVANGHKEKDGGKAKGKKKSREAEANA
jgi:hypothetical protein